MENPDQYAKEFVREMRAAKGLNTEHMRLKSDGDGHWYLVPLDQESAFDSWLEDPEMPYLDPPRGTVQIDGPHTLVIKEWSEE